jgi:CRP-like cAMP-binding protein
MARVEIARGKRPTKAPDTFNDLERILSESTDLCALSANLSERVCRVLSAHDVRMKGYAAVYNLLRAGAISPDPARHWYNWFAYRDSPIDQNIAQDERIGAVSTLPALDPASLPAFSEQPVSPSSRTIEQGSSAVVDRIPGAGEVPALEHWAKSRPVRPVARGRRIAGDLEIRSRLLLLVSGHAKLGFTRVHPGETRASLIRSKSRGRLLAFLGAGDFITMLRLLHDQIHPMRMPSLLYYCDALTDCVVAEVTPQDFTETPHDGKRGPNLRFPDQAVSRWLSLITWQSSLVDLDVRGRLLACLKGLAARFGTPGKHGTSIELPLTQRDLAKLVGASRPKVSMVLSSLQREGVLKKIRQQVILEPKHLSRTANGDSSSKDSANRVNRRPPPR